MYMQSQAEVQSQVDTQFKIAELNDATRKYGLQFILTRGIKELPDLPGLIQQVREFDKFNEDNDPYGEHDYGSFDWFGQRVLWKIDYYNPDLQGGCDPLSPKCRRILTVMLAHEY